jgi:hypothetical protein
MEIEGSVDMCCRPTRRTVLETSTELPALAARALPAAAQKRNEPSRIAMSWPSSETRAALAKRVGIPVGLSGVGTGAWLILDHQGHAPVQIIVGALVAIIGIACASAPKIIEARSQAEISRAQAQAIRLQAESDSETQRLRAQTHVELLRSGLDESKTNQAERMLRYQLLYPDLPKGRRLNDGALVDLAKEEVKKSIEAAGPSSTDGSSAVSPSPSGELPNAANGDVHGVNGGVVLNMRTED